MRVPVFEGLIGVTALAIVVSVASGGRSQDEKAAVKMLPNIDVSIDPELVFAVDYFCDPGNPSDRALTEAQKQSARGVVKLTPGYLGADGAINSCSTGSGVYLTGRYVITNYHVASVMLQANQAFAEGRPPEVDLYAVTAERDVIAGKIVCMDPSGNTNWDLAIVELERIPDLPKVPLATAAAGLNEEVGLVGYPISRRTILEATTIASEISEIPVQDKNIQSTEGLIRVSKGIQPGFSGGAGLDATGALIGITTLSNGRDVTPRSNPIDGGWLVGVERIQEFLTRIRDDASYCRQ